MKRAVCPLGVKPIGALQGVGISYVVALLVSHKANSADIESEDTPVISLVIRSAITPLMFLAFGFVVHSFM